ncbi:MAG: hypothetical protein Q8M31_21865 [Beijerinckiaceae bacterium]|nr:hypothetical protein [Beijerinckiaceae bacterium]
MTQPNRYWPTYPRMTWRSASPVVHDGEFGFSLQTEDGSVLRYRIPAESARMLAISIFEAIQRTATNSHSPMSSGSPSVPGSNPAEGQ